MISHYKPCVGPDSKFLVALLIIGFAALAWAMIHVTHLWVKIGSAALALVVAMTAGVAVVNDYYGYYRTWGALETDLSGSYQPFGNAHARERVDGFPRLTGRLIHTHFPGPRSGLNRPGLVYLPPQYGQKRYAHLRFPVVELLHGSPGGDTQWVEHLDLVQLADKLISKHLMGPEIFVMPTFNTPTQYQECVNGPEARDDTYIATDVPGDVERTYRASLDRAEWGIAGFSAGGYCAANLSLRHRNAYGAAGIIDGYFRPGDGDAVTALNANPAAERANDPLQTARRLTVDSSPVPAYWVSAGSGLASDYQGARQFVDALRRVESVTFDVEPGAGHNFYAWQAAVPHLLVWTWQQLSTPGLRADFPTFSGSERSALLPTSAAAKKNYPPLKHPKQSRPTR